MPIWPLLRSRLRSLLLGVDILLMVELLMLLPCAALPMPAHRALSRLAHTVSNIRHQLCSLLGRFRIGMTGRASLPIGSANAEKKVRA